MVPVWNNLYGLCQNKNLQCPIFVGALCVNFYSFSIFDGFGYFSREEFRSKNFSKKIKH